MTGVLYGRYSLAQSGAILRARTGAILRACFQVGRENTGNGVRYFFKSDGHKLDIEDISEWEPVIVHDYSKSEEMREVVYDLGAKAFKSKDLNYYYVDELLAANREGRPAKEQKGRFEDPNVELLEKSGEDLLDQAGNPVEVEVRDFNVAKREWIDGKPPTMKRKMMNYGYKEISNIDWVDCV